MGEDDDRLCFQPVTFPRESWYLGDGMECVICDEPNAVKDLIEFNDNEYHPTFCANCLVGALTMMGVKVAFEVGQEKIGEEVI